MDYKFPYISHINDVLPYVEGAEEFVVARKEGYTVINYVMMTSDTFRANGDPLRAAIRRECRGITFDNHTGLIIRRPYHKFFNAGENEETQLNNLDLNNKHRKLDKLDGSMIAPFKLANGSFLIGTKMGTTTVAEQAAVFMADLDNYHNFMHESIDQNLTPIFEWCSEQQRIVLKYDEDQLILTGMRDMNTGEYLTYEEMTELADVHEIPVVRDFKLDLDIHTFTEHTRAESGFEGYVVRFDDGHMFKLKSDWYVAIHKAKEDILYERLVVLQVLENGIDDIIPFLSNEDADRITRYRDEFLKQYFEIIISVTQRSYNALVHAKMSRKEFAIQHAPSYGPFASLIFRNFDEIHNHTEMSWHYLIADGVKETVIKYCNSNTRFAEFKKTASLETEWKPTYQG